MKVGSLVKHLHVPEVGVGVVVDERYSERGATKIEVNWFNLRFDSRKLLAMVDESDLEVISEAQ